MFRTICYECDSPCERAGKKVSENSRECNGWKDPKFVGCCALESPEEAEERQKKEARQRRHQSSSYNTMQLALKKAGII